MIRLGDGTDESHARMQAAIDELWTYAGEMFVPDEVELALVDAGVAADVRALQAPWDDAVNAVLAEATLTRPGETFVRKGGKQGVHTEHFGRLLAEMQFLQRAYPGCELVMRTRAFAIATRRSRMRRRRVPLEAVWEALRDVPDPEIPVVSIVELGIVRGVDVDGRHAPRARHADLLGLSGDRRDPRGHRQRAARHRRRRTSRSRSRSSPAWTTDWIAPEAKEKLRGLRHRAAGCRPRSRIDVAGISPLRRKTRRALPALRIDATSLLAQFGSTACKALYRCDSCREPFDYFKPF